MAKRTDRTESSQNKAVEQEIQTEIELGLDALEGTHLEDMENLEAELGMAEIYLDEAELDTIAAEDTDGDFDTTAEGFEDSVDAEPIVDNRPQSLTESYGTGLQGQPSDRAGQYSRWNETHSQNESGAILTGGDVDADYGQAEAVGDEAVGGTTATPDQNVVDDLAAAVGIEIDDRSFLRTGDMLEQRDDRRWELDPQSSEDYENRHE